MQISSVTFKQFYTPHLQKSSQKSNEQCELVETFCSTFELPDENCNHAKFDENLVQKIASYKEKAIQPVTDMLAKTDNEKDATAGLFLLNRIIDAGAKGVENTYPVISKFNYSKSPNVQTMLAGIYRKTLVPDGFGALMTMYVKNLPEHNTKPFDPNEEICGAMLAYLNNDKQTCNNFLEGLKNKAAINNYTK